MQMRTTGRIGFVGLLAALFITFVAYGLLFSQQDKIQQQLATVAGVQTTTPFVEVPQSAADERTTEVPQTNTTPIASTVSYIANSGKLLFLYPETFTTKQQTRDCLYCPELILEKDSEQLVFGTLPQGSSVPCEQPDSQTLPQKIELAANVIATVYSYSTTSEEECATAGLPPYGIKATFEYDGISYYLDHTTTMPNNSTQLLEVVRTFEFLE